MYGIETINGTAEEQAGWSAYEIGAYRDECPHLAYTPAWSRWLRGWMRAADLPVPA